MLVGLFQIEEDREMLQFSVDLGMNCKNPEEVKGPESKHNHSNQTQASVECHRDLSS